MEMNLFIAYIGIAVPTLASRLWLVCQALVVLTE